MVNAYNNKAFEIFTVCDCLVGKSCILYCHPNHAAHCLCLLWLKMQLWRGPYPKITTKKFILRWWKWQLTVFVKEHIGVDSNFNPNISSIFDTLPVFFCSKSFKQSNSRVFELDRNSSFSLICSICFINSSKKKKKKSFFHLNRLGESFWVFIWNTLSQKSRSKIVKLAEKCECYDHGGGPCHCFVYLMFVFCRNRNLQKYPGLLFCFHHQSGPLLFAKSAGSLVSLSS